ncbi:hypothetical protein A2U01_0095949, partial [Trifolium medium]|nr:hypothetical protein [Trifolium medium]
ELMLRLDDEQVCFKVFEAIRSYDKTPECYKVEMIEEEVVDVKEAEWDHEIEFFLQQLDDGLEEAPKVVEKLPELKELP